MNTFIIKALNDKEHFDPSTLSQHVPFTQADVYGLWQKNLGREVKRFLISDNSGPVAYFQILRLPLVFGKTYLYVPLGPVIKNVSEPLLVFLKQELQKIAHKENAVFTRLDFSPRIASDVASKFFTKSPLCTYHSAYFQPRVEWFLKLDKTENEILMAMHEKTRYSIRLAERKQITSEIVTENFEKYFDIFYQLMSDTAKRNNFNLHSKEYYQNVFAGLDSENAYISVAKFGEKVLAIDLVIVFSGVANYVFGGSSAEERNRMPTYLAQWRAVCHAKKLGCDFYSFGAISAEADIHKSWDGITAFKKKFGGEAVVRSDFFDVVASPFWYYMYNLRRYFKSLLR